MSDVGNEVVPVTPAEAPAPEIETTAVQSSPPEGETPEAPPEKLFTQSDLDKKVGERLGKESKKLMRIAQAEARAEWAEKQLASLQAPKQPVQRTGAPQREQFQDDIAYVEALTDWKVDQKMNGYQQQTAAQKEAEAQRQRADSVQQRLSSTAKKYSDFNEVALADDVPISQAMAAAIAESEQGGEVAYYLGSNIEEAERISQLSPVGQIRAIAAIEAKLSAAPTVTRTSAPIVPNAGKAPVKRDTFELPWSEFVAQRRKETARK